MLNERLDFYGGTGERDSLHWKRGKQEGRKAGGDGSHYVKHSLQYILYGKRSCRLYILYHSQFAEVGLPPKEEEMGMVMGMDMEGKVDGVQGGGSY